MKLFSLSFILIYFDYILVYLLLVILKEIIRIVYFMVWGNIFRKWLYMFLVCFSCWFCLWFVIKFSYVFMLFWGFFLICVLRMVIGLSLVSIGIELVFGWGRILLLGFMVWGVVEGLGSVLFVWVGVFLLFLLLEVLIRKFLDILGFCVWGGFWGCVDDDWCLGSWVGVFSVIDLGL